MTCVTMSGCVQDFMDSREEHGDLSILDTRTFVSGMKTGQVRCLLTLQQHAICFFFLSDVSRCAGRGWDGVGLCRAVGLCEVLCLAGVGCAVLCAVLPVACLALPCCMAVALLLVISRLQCAPYGSRSFYHFSVQG